MKLVDTLDEQDVLESLIEEAKPSVPVECRHLHYLLSTPFRYGAAYPAGSRFRRAGLTEGVYYAAERPTTAVAEMAFYRLLFHAESPGTPWPSNPAEYTAFSAAYRTARAIDLSGSAFAGDRTAWEHPTDYDASQQLAEQARSAGIEIIRYASIRDPDRGMNLALLACTVFTTSEPTAWQTWRIHLQPSGVQAICEFPTMRLAFDRLTFAGDPRISGMRWDR